MTPNTKEFETFWDSLDQELASVPLDLVTERDEFYSEPEWTVYRMTYSSLRGYRLFSWLSVPRQLAQSKAPAVIRMPDYASVHDVIYTSLRHNSVLMNPTYRGQRLSDGSFQAQYPGLLTEGIDQPDNYVMRLAFGDALRAVDALLGQDIVEVGPWTAMGSGLGGSLALASAFRRSTCVGVAADTPLALGNPAVVNPESMSENMAYPLAELGDYLRIYPHRSSKVVESSSPLDPVKMAAEIEAPVLLALGKRDRGQCPLPVGEELASRLPKCDLRVYDGANEGGGHEHVAIRIAWLKERLGIA